jgi:hypothetical protein
MRTSRWTIAPDFIVDDVVSPQQIFTGTNQGSRTTLFWRPAVILVTRSEIVIMLSQLPGTGLMRPNSIADHLLLPSSSPPID